MKSTIHTLKELLEKTTPGEWVIRELPGGSDYFIQAPRLDPTHPYDVDILGEDDTLYPTKRADAEFIVVAHNLLPELFDYIRELEEKIYPLKSANPETYIGSRQIL